VHATWEPLITSRNFKRDHRGGVPAVYRYIVPFYLIVKSLKNFFCCQRALRQGPSLLYYRPRLTNHGNGDGDPGVPGELRAAESGTPCEKKPRLLPSSRSFAAEERTPAGTPHLYYTRKRLISANGMEMEILPRSSWPGPREGYTKYLASSLNLVSMEMENSCAPAAWKDDPLPCYY